MHVWKGPLYLEYNLKRELKPFVAKQRRHQMRAREVECFRPLLLAQQWDYIVVWKLGDDPSRFIEWMGCCCSGGYECGNAKEERGENSHLSSFCKDTYLKHHVRTKACEALAQLPSSMPLYSGVHTEVVISRQPRWLSQVENGTDSNPSHNSAGTQALIPVDDGLIDFYSLKHIPKDQKILEMILAHCNISLEQGNLDIQPQKCIQKQPSSVHLLSLSPGSEAFQQVSSGSRTSMEGPFTASSSNLSNEHLWFGSECANNSESGPSKLSYERASGLTRLDYNEEFLKRQARLVSCCEAEKAAKKVTKRKERGNYKSTNLVSERNRRKRIKTALFALRSLVPNITKMDTASIVGDAVTYIRELQKEEKELQEELKKMEEEEEECPKIKNGFAVRESDKSKGVASCLPPAENIPKMKTEMQVEVKQIGKTGCFIKVFSEHKQGGFVKLMEAIESLELQVVSANFTAFNGRVQNVIEVKADKDIQAMKLRNLLIELTG